MFDCLLMASSGSGGILWLPWFQGHIFPLVEHKWILHFRMLACGTWLIMFIIYVRSIYHCLTSITSAFHFDKMRFVSGKLDGCVVSISYVRGVDGMTSDGSCFALCKWQFLSHLRILLYRAFLHKNLIILMERG